jgi:hypothetical protein
MISPWDIAIAWLVTYEIWAVLTGHTTLSRMVWRSNKRWKWFKWVALGVIGVLIAHLWFGLWGPSAFDVQQKPDYYNDY